MVLSGRIYPIVERAAGVIVRDRTGHVLPSQIVTADRDKQGNLVMAEIAFPAQKVPSVGYDTYYLEFTPELGARLPPALVRGAPFRAPT